MTGRTPADQEMNEYSRRVSLDCAARFPALVVDERGGDETEETAVRPAGLSR
jgi:hypothetical protein